METVSERVGTTSDGFWQGTTRAGTRVVRFRNDGHCYFIPLFAYLLSLGGKVTGIALIDSTSIAVCDNQRIRRNKVFRNLAKRDKTTSGWFYGFKLHWMINDKREIWAVQLTPENVSDVSMVATLSQNIFGKLFGAKGDISAEVGGKLLQWGLQ